MPAQHFEPHIVCTVQVLLQDRLHSHQLLQQDYIDNQVEAQCPQYYIHNQSSSITIPTSPVTGNGTPSDTNPAGYTGTDMPIGGYKVTSDDGSVATNTSDGAGSNF